MKSRPIVLLVEGDENEELLARQAITNSEIDCDVQVARSEAEVCKMLFESGNPPPTLILIDLDAHGLNGFRVLTLIRDHELTKRLPVVVLSESGNQADVSRSFDLHVNSYVQKDDDLDFYETRLKLLLYYWFAVNKNGNA